MKNLKLFTVLSVLILCAVASAQNVQDGPSHDRNPLPSSYPHPYLFGGVQLNGGGYSPFSQTVGAGVNVELKKLVFTGEASYDNSHKTNDGTGSNPNGHDRRLNGNAFYRLNKWYVGGGAFWSQLSTTNYSKQSWHPQVGGGRDWIRDDFSMRGQVVYILPGSDHQNAVQGPEFSLWIPSPATNHHLFWYETVGVYESHQTVTDPTNLALTQLQTSKRSASGWVTMTMMYRF